MHLPLTRLIPLIAWLLTMFIAPTALAQEQVEIEGATFPTRIEQQGQSYRLIGSGMFRYLMWDA